MTQIPTHFQPIIEKCYDIFRYPRPISPVNACTCPICLDPKLELEMRQLPLRELTRQHFYEYNTSPTGMPENPNEVKYFLPRMIELLVQGESLHHSEPLYFWRVGACPKDSFSTEEMAIWQQFAQMYLTQLLHEPVHDFPDLFDYILMFYKGHIDIKPFLHYWQHDDSPQAVLQFVHSTYWEYCHNTPIDNPFADNDPEYKHIMQTWLNNPQHKQQRAKQLLNLPPDFVQKYNKEFDANGKIDYLFDLLVA